MKKELLTYDDANYYFDSALTMNQAISTTHSIDQLQFDLTTSENDENFYQTLGKSD